MNNGFMSGGVCLSPQQYIISYSASNSGVICQFNVYSNWPDSYGRIYCGSSQDPISPVYNCEISGPPLTEQQQIEAINGLFPFAVGVIAVAWGLKFIRGLIENWLRDRNSDD